jgi:hypothetical protein
MTIERANPGQTVFKEFGYVAPAGWSQQGSDYSFTDREIHPNGIYRYRIKATDLMGLEYISPEIVLEITDTKGLLVLPNPPVNGMINVFSESEMKWLRIIDNLGRVVLTAQPNATQFSVRLPVLASGIYYLQAFMVTGTQTTRLFISH